MLKDPGRRALVTIAFVSLMAVSVASGNEVDHFVVPSASADAKLTLTPREQRAELVPLFYSSVMEEDGVIAPVSLDFSATAANTTLDTYDSQHVADPRSLAFVGSGLILMALRRKKIQQEVLQLGNAR